MYNFSERVFGTTLAPHAYLYNETSLLTTVFNVRITFFFFDQTFHSK